MIAYLFITSHNIKFKVMIIHLKVLIYILCPPSQNLFNPVDMRKFFECYTLLKRKIF